jgi:hypothetical protein
MRSNWAGGQGICDQSAYTPSTPRRRLFDLLVTQGSRTGHACIVVSLPIARVAPTAVRSQEASRPLVTTGMPGASGASGASGAWRRPRPYAVEYTVEHTNAGATSRWRASGGQHGSTADLPQASITDRAASHHAFHIVSRYNSSTAPPVKILRRLRPPPTGERDPLAQSGRSSPAQRRARPAVLAGCCA